MREGWRETTLGEVADINPEPTPRWPNDHEIKYVDIASVAWGKALDASMIRPQPFGSAPGRARRLIRAGDVVVSTVRPNLKAMATVPPELDGEVASTGLAVLRARDDVSLPGYVWALVSHQDFSEDMVRKATGSNYPAVRPADVSSYPVLLPPLSEQRRIVDLIGAVDDAIEAADSVVARDLYDAALGLLTGNPGHDQPLGSALSLKRESEPVVRDLHYRILGVLRSGEGFIDRGVIHGSETGYARMTKVGTDQLVYRKLTAWEGPISVSSEEEAGGWVSPEFPVFNVNSSLLRPALLRHYCRWPGLWSRIGDRLVGSVQRRKRLNPDALVQIQLPIPPLETQDSWVFALDGMWEVVSQRANAEADLRTLRSNLLTALLSGEHEMPESYDELIEEAS